MLARLRNFLEHPWTNFTVAVVLIITSLAEGWDSFVDDLTRFDAGVHHGVLIFGFLQLLRALSDIIDAAKRVAKLSG